MIFIAFILSLVFGSIGFVVTKNNARYILSGYNTMSEQDRQQFDITSYLAYFKKFHLILAGALLGGVLLLSLINNNWASIFMIEFPLCAYLYFLISTSAHYHTTTKQKQGTYIAGGVLSIIILVLMFESFTDYKSSELVLGPDMLEIRGSFGVTLNKAEVIGYELVDKLPEIAYKTGGFAAGDYAKGKFKTKNGKFIWLYVNKNVSPYLLIKSSKGEIYYNHDKTRPSTFREQLRNWLGATR
ncbi:DUF3784 domain-containing protein [Salmonirosea aquatica]|uniref:DUF3784 domain-containing protein n=1 Tax=Salmonirosea aquatica TaxID=2654236 RepID=A0A7C9BG54_9BACT|nr:DUF3784 domain-containing protein [Cytophagaceae bacterium SJW1-29]